MLRHHEQVVSWAEAQSPAELSVSAITSYELRYGVMRCAAARRKRETKKVEMLLEMLGDLPFTRQTSVFAADIRSELERAGKPIGAMDILIAATALERGLKLVTGNVREFSRVDGLKVSSWKE